MFLVISILLSTIILIPDTTAWKNGPQADEFSPAPETLRYGTHDWLAEHALDWLPEHEKRYILNNLNLYLYGTELPDKTTGADAIGDVDKQHFYFNETGAVKDNSAGVRTAQEYYKAVEYLENGDLYNGTMHLGIMTHYIADLAVYHNVMNATYWGEPDNYDEYIDYVNLDMQSYSSLKFDKYLKFDGTLFILPPDDAANAVAYNTTFDALGISTRKRALNPGVETCTWMDTNFDWQSNAFKDRCGESLNYAVNIITDVLHTLYVYNSTPPEPPKNLKVKKAGGDSVELTWDANNDKNLAGYSIYVNKSGTPDQFIDIPYNVTKKFTSYTVKGLDDEIKYFFKITAYNVLNKNSDFSNTVSATTLDITSPPAPKLGDLPEITNKRNIDITGFYTPEPGALIQVFINNLSQPVASNYSNAEYLGFYKVPVILLEGDNNVSLRALDSAGNPSAFSKSKIIVLDSIKPIADAGGNRDLDLGKEPIKIYFNAANSTDNSGVIANYSWTIDYDFEIYYLYGVSPVFTFDKAGDYICELQVTDLAGNFDTSTFWINITQLDIDPPTIESRTPDKDEINVSINITIEVKFSEPLDTNKLKLRLISSIDGELQIPKPKYFPWSGLTIKPFTNLTHNTTYMIIITGMDLAGNELLDSIWNFTTVPRPIDFDGDQLPDLWEWKYGLDANKSDSSEDPDYDKLSNFDEYNKGFNSTNPKNPDTDGDGMSDYFERLFNLRPLDPSDRDLDPDLDGKTNYQEYLGLDGLPDNMDWTNPNEKPEKKEDKDDDGEDSLTVIIIIIIIIFVLVFLLILAFKVRYKETGIKKIEDEAEDDYFKTEDPDELGIGGDLLFEESKNYTEAKGRREQPETGRSIVVGKSSNVVKPKGKTDEPTPEEILERATKDEKKCTKCGAGLPKDTNYCFECGEIFNDKSK